MQALMMMNDKRKDDEAKGIIMVVPYLGYSCQDRSFLDGEVVGSAYDLGRVSGIV